MTEKASPERFTAYRDGRKVEAVLASEHDAAVELARIVGFSDSLGALLEAERARAEAAEAELAKVSGFIAQGAPVATNRALRAKLRAAEASNTALRAELAEYEHGTETLRSYGDLGAEIAALRAENERLKRESDEAELGGSPFAQNLASRAATKGESEA